MNTEQFYRLAPEGGRRWGWKVAGIAIGLVLALLLVHADRVARAERRAAAAPGKG